LKELQFQDWPQSGALSLGHYSLEGQPHQDEMGFPNLLIGRKSYS